MTARDTVEDRVDGLEKGCDDYLTKPFALKELFDRLQALLRRAAKMLPTVLQVADLTRNTVKLNPIGFRLLQELMHRSPGIVPRERLLAVGWGTSIPSSDSLRTNIYLLRKAVDAEGEAPLIQTHPGFGWACAPSDEPKA